ncbi:MAG: sigma-70 family RNA polymerase sigma factor [Proteobacteria bacterium]|nr:sigma-70 family RNA polymerase sigma factor [Pseudomonadota bacterium]
MDGAVFSMQVQPLKSVAENPPDRSDDHALVRAALTGDTRAFERLYRSHVGRVYGAILRLVGMDRARAEELTQEAFIQAWRKLASFRFDAAFSTWLYRLGVNTALMELRGKRDEVNVDDDVLALAAGGEVPFCAGERGDLERAVAKLPPRARAVLVLHDIEGWKHEEIAAELGMAVGSSKAQLHRARGLMRTTLQAA